MAVIDCFPFFNEIELLKIRLAELDGVVDRFVLVEATRTHRGKPKPLYFRERSREFARWGERIAAFVVDDLPQATDGDAWPAERHQRARIGGFLAAVGCAPDDLVLLSDVDEIPRASAIPAAMGMVRKRRFAIFVQTLIRFYLNNVTVNERHRCGWCGTVAFRYRELEHATTDGIRGRWCSGGQLYRHASWMRRRHCIPDAGWHLTSMGGPAVALYKRQSFAHSEEDDPSVPRARPVAMGVDDAGPVRGACHIVDGSCVCGCTWKGVAQVYTPLLAGCRIDAPTDLPDVVRRRPEEFRSLFRFCEAPPSGFARPDRDGAGRAPR